MTTKPLNPARPRGRDYILPSLAALACAGAAYAGADTTFDPAPIHQAKSDDRSGPGRRARRKCSTARGCDRRPRGSCRNPREAGRRLRESPTRERFAASAGSCYVLSIFLQVSCAASR